MLSYDVGIVGGGPGGYVAAIKGAQSGLRVVLFERHRVGGVCLNYGCIPTKTLLKTARLFQEIKHAEHFGIDLPLDVMPVINWEHLMQRKDKVVKQLVSGVEGLLKSNGVHIVYGEAVVKSPHLIEVDTNQYNISDLIIATGSSTHMPSLEGLEMALKTGFVIDSTGAIALESQPKTLVILGGGVIAVEFATLYRSLGTEVYMILRSKEVLNQLDQDVQSTMQQHLVQEGVNIISEAQVKAILSDSIRYEKDGMIHQLKCDKVLMSMGREPNRSGLEVLGLAIGKNGITTDERLRTNVPHVYAIGDVNGKFMLAHVASQEGIVAIENILGKDSKMDYQKIPSCIYSFPEVGVVGMTESEARKNGHQVITSLFPLKANGKALAEGESTGFVKIIADKAYGEILGVHIVAAHATDMIAEAVVTMALEGTVHDVARAVHPHPTLSEIVMEAAHGAVDKPIHFFKKS